MDAKVSKKKASRKKASKKKAARKVSDQTMGPAKKTRTSEVPETVMGLKTADLPAELQAELKGKRQSNTQAYVLEVLPPKGGEPMSVNDIIVAVWQAHKTVIKRASVLAALQALAAKNQARRAGTGAYTQV